jgi:hypothetical protein
MQQTRDPGIDVIHSRPGRQCYGMGLGVLILDDVYPGFPGDVRNASAFPYPVQYELVEGIDINQLAYSDDRDACLEPIQRAARKLERLGVRAIVSECGHFSYFQKKITASVDIPVFLSSMMQVPWAQQVIGPEKVVGLLVSHTDPVTPAHLDAVGIREDSNVVIRGARNDGKCPAFDRLWVKDMRADPVRVSYREAEEQFVRMAVDFFADTPNMGALVLECTGFPPFARAIQRRIDIPVFSFSTLMDFAYSVAAHRDFYGHV